MSSIHTITSGLQNTSISYARVAAQGQHASAASASTSSLTEEKAIDWLSGHKGGIWRLAAAGENQVISCSYDKTAKIWDVQRQRCLQTFRPKSKEVLCAAATDHHLFTGTGGGSISIWNAHNFSLSNTIHDPDGQGIYSITTIDDKAIATGSSQRPEKHQGPWNHDIKVFDIDSKHLSLRLRGHNGGIPKIVKLSSQHLASCSADASIKVWNLQQGQCTMTLEKAHSDYIYGLDASGSSIVSGGRDRQLNVFDKTTLALKGRLTSGKDGLAHSSTIYDVCKIAEHLFASASRDGIVKVWDLRSFSHVSSLDVQDSFAYSIAALANDTLVIGTAGSRKKTDSKETNPVLTLWHTSQH